MIIQPGHALYDTFGGIHHIYANKTCMKALQSGKAFPDGAILIFDLLEVKSADNTLTEGQRKVLGVMQKDSKRFAGTGGWGFEGLDPWLLAALRNLTKPDAHMITDYVLPQAPRTLARVLAGGEILDIGSGEGFHLLHYARRYPRSQVMGLELDSAKVETARKNIAEAFLGERVSLREGDVNQLDEGGVYDLIPEPYPS